jgi:L-lactate dehydrogenase
LPRPAGPYFAHADVIGEHGTSQVYLWSRASVAGMPVLPFLLSKDRTGELEEEVRYANININALRSVA